MFKTIENIIRSRAFAEALRTHGQDFANRKRLDVLRAELENHRAVADSVTSAIEDEIAELENTTETEEEAPAEAPAARDHGKRDSLTYAAGRVLGFLSVGFAMAALVAWTNEE